MLLAEVLGRVWSERQVPDLDGRRMVLVRELSTSAAHVAVDAAVVALVAGADRLPTPVTSGTPRRAERRAERTSP